MGHASIMDAETWIAKAREFYSNENWIGALSSVRNALRIDVKNLEAWHLGSDTLMRQDRAYLARRFAMGLRRFATKVQNRAEVEFAEKRIAEVDLHYATQHLRRGETDLTHFAARGDVQKVRQLLESGVNPDERNGSNWTALHCLSMSGKIEIARLLVEHGANLEAEEDLNETPLITACRFGNAPLVRFLIGVGADVKHIGKEKHTALWYAISSMKDLEIVKLLIDSGASANETYQYRDNPFLLAVSAQCASVTNYLLPLTRTPGRINDHDVCALHFAASYDDFELIEKLLARGVDVNTENSYGHLAIMSAGEKNSINAARVLLAHGADPFAKSKYGDTAISLAEHFGHAEVYELMTGKPLARRD